MVLIEFFFFFYQNHPNHIHYYCYQDRFDGHNFVEFAAQGNQCSAEHLKYLHSKHAEVVWMSQLSSV